MNPLVLTIIKMNKIYIQRIELLSRGMKKLECFEKYFNNMHLMYKIPIMNVEIEKIEILIEPLLHYFRIKMEQIFVFLILLIITFKIVLIFCYVLIEHFLL